MNSIVFDGQSDVEHPLNDGLTIGLLARRDALAELARQVRLTELTELEERERSMWVDFPYPFVYGAFSWFATSLTAYLQLLPIADQLRKDPSLLHSLAQERNSVKRAGLDLVETVCPEVQAWRNQVGAHASLADPRKQDNVALLLASVTHTIHARSQRFYVGIGAHAIISTEDRRVLASHSWEAWSITETYERLTPRFWPDRTLASLTSTP